MAGKTVVAALLVAVLILVPWQSVRSDRRAQQAEERSARFEKQLEIMRRQLAKQTELAEKVLAKIDRTAAPLPGAGQPDPLPAAQAEVAAELKIPLDELKKRLAQNGADVRGLIADIEKERKDAGAKMGGVDRASA